MGGIAYVATCRGAVLAVGLASHRLLGTVLANLGGPPGTMDYDAVTGQIYVPVPATNSVEILRPAAVGTNGNLVIPVEPLHTLSFTGDPSAVAITFEGALGFVAERGSGRVVELDITSRQTLGAVTVGGAPQAIITGPYPPALDRQTTVIVVALILGAFTIGLSVLLFLAIREALRARRRSQMMWRAKPQRQQDNAGQYRTARHPALLALVVCSVLLLVGMAGCTSGSSSASSAYGGSQNHLHDLLPLHGFAGTVLLATHLGLYRTTDRGQTWREVAGGSGQPMDGLMIFKLAQSPVDPQRIYALATLRTSTPPPAAPGLYTSADAGQTWRLAASFASFSTQGIYTMGAGAQSSGDVYAFLPARASDGLVASDDAGAHWLTLPSLPIEDIAGVVDDPAHPDHMFIWSPASGLYQSANHGTSWTAVSTVQGGVYAVSFAGSLIYVQSDSGIFASDT